MSKCLVTGADGFIGSHLVEELLRQGREVRAFVWYNARGSWGWLDELPAELRGGLEVVLGDIRDFRSVRSAVRGCDTVFHLAALIGIPYSYEAPQSYIETNVSGTLNLLSASAEEAVARFVQTSTSEVYGTAQFVPITEEHPLCAQSPYAASKIGGDQMALAFHRSSGLPIVVLRPFNTYGPRQSGRAVIPAVISQILLQQGQAVIRMGALAPTRDFTFVVDTVRGFIAAAAASRGVGEVIQLGTDHEIGMGELAMLIGEVAGRSLRIETEAGRQRPATSEVMQLRASFAKARTLLGWEPQYAGREGLRRGLELTIEWFSNPKNMEFYRSGRYQV